MFEIQGKYGIATFYADHVEQEAVSQVFELCNQDFTKNKSIKIMPDVHAGKGCVVGFTAELGDKVIPSLIGLDIGCGMETSYIPEFTPENMDFSLLEQVIKEFVPSGRNAHNDVQAYFDLKELACYNQIKSPDYVMRSIGSLGGGNHFIEVNVNKTGQIYLVIHSGSRNLGKQVAEYYQEVAYNQCRGYNPEIDNILKKEMIKQLKSQGKEKDIQKALQEFDKKSSNKKSSIPKDLCYLEGQAREDYLHDMNICVKYADLNRKTMVDIILHNYFGQTHKPIIFSSLTTIHNYIDTEDGIIRKGAIKANKGQVVLIPLNRRDGSIIAVGKGNPDWNNSAPHGAGRIMSRSKAKELLNVEDYKLLMEDIYATNVDESTLDESPQAYKPMQQIIDAIGDTVDIKEVIKPLYNFKAGE